MQSIQLSNSNILVLVDDDMEQFLTSEYRWCAVEEQKTTYAVSSGKKDNGVRMQRILWHYKTGVWSDTWNHVDHIDRVGWHNWFTNLRLIPRGTNINRDRSCVLYKPINARGNPDSKPYKVHIREGSQRKKTIKTLLFASYTTEQEANDRVRAFRLEMGINPEE
jgi:hypothetical protein